MKKEQWAAIALGLVGACSSNNGTESETAASLNDETTRSEGYACPTEFSEIHDCAGMNTCRGLGGCSVDADKLARLAECMGIPVSEAGETHDCSGMNSCRGLGGCSVDAEKLERLRAALDG